MKNSKENIHFYITASRVKPFSVTFGYNVSTKPFMTTAKLLMKSYLECAELNVQSATEPDCSEEH